MNRYRIIAGLLMLSMIAAGQSWADTDTVDAEIVAAIKAGPAAVKNLEQSAVKTIKSDADALEKDHACRILRVIGTADSVDAVATLLTDEKLSHIARYVLEYMQFPEADAALIAAIGKTTGQVKVGIINSIAMRSNEQNIDTLLPLLEDTDADVAGAAAWALGRIGSPKAVSALSDCYKIASKQMRVPVADGLLNAAAKLIDQGSFQQALAIYTQLQSPDAPEHVQMGAYAGSIEAQPEKATEMLIAAIGSDDWKIQGMAIDMIVTLKGDGVTQRFSAGLDTLDDATQVLVIGALIARGEKDALRPVITKAVSNSNPEIRTLAIKALGDAGNAGGGKGHTRGWYGGFAGGRGVTPNH